MDDLRKAAAPAENRDRPRNESANSICSFEHNSDHRIIKFVSEVEAEWIAPWAVSLGGKLDEFAAHFWCALDSMDAADLHPLTCELALEGRKES